MAIAPDNWSLFSDAFTKSFLASRELRDRRQIAAQESKDRAAAAERADRSFSLSLRKQQVDELGQVVGAQKRLGEITEDLGPDNAGRYAGEYGALRGQLGILGVDVPAGPTAPPQRLGLAPGPSGRSAEAMGGNPPPSDGDVEAARGRPKRSETPEPSDSVASSTRPPAPRQNMTAWEWLDTGAWNWSGGQMDKFYDRNKNAIGAAFGREISNYMEAAASEAGVAPHELLLDPRFSADLTIKALDRMTSKNLSPKIFNDLMGPLLEMGAKLRTEMRSGDDKSMENWNREWDNAVAALGSYFGKPGGSIGDITFSISTQSDKVKFATSLTMIEEFMSTGLATTGGKAVSLVAKMFPWLVQTDVSGYPGEKTGKGRTQWTDQNIPKQPTISIEKMGLAPGVRLPVPRVGEGEKPLTQEQIRKNGVMVYDEDRGGLFIRYEPPEYRAGIEAIKKLYGVERVSDALPKMSAEDTKTWAQVRGMIRMWPVNQPGR